MLITIAVLLVVAIVAFFAGLRAGINASTIAHGWRRSDERD